MTAVYGLREWKGSSRKESGPGLEEQTNGRLHEQQVNPAFVRLSRDLAAIHTSHLIGEVSISNHGSTPNTGDVLEGETTAEYKERCWRGFSETSAHARPRLLHTVRAVSG